MIFYKVKKKYKTKTRNTGFTLLEMIISIGIFSVVIIASIGITLSISNAQIKSANMQAILDNTRFNLELMTKEIRTGGSFSTSSPICAPLGSEIRFYATSGRRVYFWDPVNLRIMRAKEDISSIDCNGATGKAVPFSGENIYIDNLRFNTQGTIIGSSDGQPMIRIVLRARSKDKKTALESTVNLQTTVIPRIRDLFP
ncbi:MAG: prepilin-type N-terminal cleavage/methylation domain-containing protein [Candidatus Colwellbacteria bacterium]|nr:prepilin-type N-terminal cleavage/methylation domain-containing protein [Candidatus Colwellbacteria bacterium]